MRNLDWLLSFLSSCRECCCVREMGQGKICTVSPIKFTWQLKISSSGDYLTVIFSVNSEYTHFRQLMVLNTTSLARPHSPKRCFGTLAGVPALLPGLRWWWLSQFTHAQCLAEDAGRVDRPCELFTVVSVMSGPSGMQKIPISPVYHDLHFGQKNM